MRLYSFGSIIFLARATGPIWAMERDDVDGRVVDDCWRVEQEGTTKASPDGRTQTARKAATSTRAVVKALW